MRKLSFCWLVVTSIIIIDSCKPKTDNQNYNRTFTSTPISLSVKVDSTSIDVLQHVLVDTNRLKQIHLTATLANNTTELVKYYSMTCSWTDLFLTDLESFDIYKNLCFQNWWFIDSIPPYGKKHYNLTLTATPEIKETKIKLGFNFVNDDQVVVKKDIIDSLKKMNHIIWSNPITLAN